MWWLDLFTKILLVLGSLGAIVAALFAAHLWITAQRKQSVGAAKDELIKMASQSRDAWQSRYEAEHIEYTGYREKQHQQNNDANALALKLTDENAQLKGKTDLSPVMNVMTNFVEAQREFMKEQTQINGKILSALINLEARIS